MRHSRHPGYYTPNKRLIRQAHQDFLKRLWLPVLVVGGMVVIPATSLEISKSYERGIAYAESEPPVELELGGGVPSLKSYLTKFFTPGEVEELKERWYRYRDDVRIRRSVHDYAQEIAVQDYTRIPRWIRDEVYRRLGPDRVIALKQRIFEIQPAAEELERAAAVEIFRDAAQVPWWNFWTSRD